MIPPPQKPSRVISSGEVCNSASKKVRTRRDVIENRRLVTFNAEDLGVEEVVVPPKKKKVRNISEAMILEEKRALALILELKERVDVQMRRSRRRTEEKSVEKVETVRCGELSRGGFADAFEYQI